MAYDSWLLGLKGRYLVFRVQWEGSTTALL